MCFWVTPSCTYSLQATVVKNVHRKVDTQTMVRGETVIETVISTTLMPLNKVNHVPNHAQWTHSHSTTTKTNKWAGEMSADMHGRGEQINTQGPQFQQSVPFLKWIINMLPCWNVKSDIGIWGNVYYRWNLIIQTLFLRFKSISSF